MREKPKDKTRLLHMPEAVNNLFEFTKSVSFEKYQSDKILRFAVIKNLKIIGEAAYLVTKEFKTNHSDIKWEVIIGMHHV